MRPIDPSRFRHDQSPYERPETGYICGRGRAWGTPCWQGPTVDGSCGGCAQCQPVRRGDRWECRRPKLAGGPCQQGPLPDGRCAHTAPPCVPAASLRRWRGRLSALAVVFVLAGIAAFANFTSGSPAMIAALDAGPLSRAHQGFTEGQGCTACHRPHDSGPTGWLRAAVVGSDLSAACLDCHQFGGPGALPHNREFAQQAALPSPSCSTCHSEHRGAEFPVAAVDDQMCSNCHLSEVTSLAGDHPPFDARFPYQEPSRINFDHAKHLREYFVDERYFAGRDADFAAVAAGDCRACHAVESATREVTPRPYAESCSGCHDAQIRDAPLVVLATEEVLPVTALLLGLDEDAMYDVEGEDAQRAFLRALSRDGTGAFAELLALAGIPGDAHGAMLAGLGTPTLRVAARTWLDDPYADPDVAGFEADRGGWQAGENDDGMQTLQYRATGHGDPVMAAWIEALARAAEVDDAGEPALLAADTALDMTSGAGACAKCHGAGIATGVRASGRGHWSLEASAARPHFAYTHAPHLRLLAPDAGCLACHRIDPEADYAGYFADTARTFDAAAFASNFTAIDRDTCMQCHRPGAIRDDCQTCHTYHLTPSFRAVFTERGIGHHETDQDNN